MMSGLECQKLTSLRFLADRRYLAHVADKVTVFVSDYDVSFKERLDCLVFLVLLLGISFAVAARCNCKQ